MERPVYHTIISPRQTSGILYFSSFFIIIGLTISLPVFSEELLPEPQGFETCLGCHRPREAGVLQAPSLTTISRYSLDAYRISIQRGSGNMPSLGPWDEKQILEIYNYVRGTYWKEVTSSAKQFESDKQADTGRLETREKNISTRSAFPGHNLIHFPSAKPYEEGVMDFLLHHRFGNVKDGVDNLFGLDDGASVRIGLGYGITDALSVAFSRLSEDRTYEFNTKYALLDQTRGDPLTVSLLGSVAYRDQDESLEIGTWLEPFPAVTGDPTLDGILEEKYNKYNYELSDRDRTTLAGSVLFSRRISDLSFQFAPIAVHRNFVTGGKPAYNYGAHLAASLEIHNGYSISIETVASRRRDVLGDDSTELDRASYSDHYTTLTTYDAEAINEESLFQNDPIGLYARNVYFDREVPHYRIPLSLSLDIETGTHVFQIVLSNSRQLAFANALRGAEYSWNSKDLVIGFNLNRRFHLYFPDN